MKGVEAPVYYFFREYFPDVEFICVRQTAHPFGNERHTIFYRFTSILWRAPIVEGKDRRSQLGPKIHSELGRTVRLVILMWGHHSQ